MSPPCGQPLLDLERNGPNLHYSVWWRRKDLQEEQLQAGQGEGEEQPWSNVTTAGFRHVVENTETYVPYEIKVQARNDFGAGPESNVVVGFSGEDGEYTLLLMVSDGPASFTWSKWFHLVQLLVSPGPAPGFTWSSCWFYLVQLVSPGPTGFTWSSCWFHLVQLVSPGPAASRATL